jgi:hypothetical protein
MDDRRTFFQTFFPRWIGFFADSFDTQIQPVEALSKLDFLVEGISFVWTSSGSGRDARRNRIDSTKLNLWKVGLTKYRLRSVIV